jgi:hypothetical protein
MMGAKISKNQRATAAPAPRGRTIYKYGSPKCGVCGAGTRRVKAKWSVCEGRDGGNQHKLYKQKTKVGG